MKINKSKALLPIVVAAVAVSGGAAYVSSGNYASKPVFAYTSAENAQDPATAPDTYEVNIPDANLKAALNDIIAKAMNAERKRLGQPEDVVRTPDQTITAKDMKVPANMYGPLGLDSKNITNIEGLQFLVNATYLSITVNNITDVAPLRDLPKLQRLEISRNKLNNASLQTLAAMPTLTNLNIARNPDLTDISVITNRKDWRALNLGGLKFDDLTALSGMNSLQFLSIDAMNTRNKLDLTPIAALPEIISLNLGHQAVGLDEDDVAVVGNLPKLATLNITGNKIVSLDHLFQGGFDKLVGNNQSNIVADQKHFVIDLPKGQREFHNPLTGLDGGPISVIETANVKNENGGNKVKLVGLGNKGSVQVRWNTTFSHGNLTDVKFSGYITVNYDLSDNVKPVFSPEQPAKIISRKGVAINLLDVTASDADSGLSDAGVTYNNGAIGLNPDNPAKGKYTLTYTAEDKSGNRATVDREIEITDADALQAKVAGVTDESLEGYTTDSVQAVRNKKAAAEAIVAKNDATQDQIDQALTELNDAIDALETDKTPLTTALEVLSHRPEYVKTNAAVVAAEAKVRALNNEVKPDPSAVTQEAIALLEAMRQAAQDELVSRITAAEMPATTDGMEREGVEELQRVLAEVKQVRDSASTADPAKQQDVEKAVADLEKAVKDLKVDTRKLQAAAGKYNAEPEHIQQDPAVQTALAEANRVLSDSAKTPAAVDKAARDLIQALENAKQAETQRQADAADTIAEAKKPGNQSPTYFNDAQDKINAVKDAAKKAELQAELDGLKKAYDDKLEELRALLAEAKKPETTEGMTNDSIRGLQAAIDTAQDPADQGDVDQGDYDVLINDLRAAIANLVADKQPLDEAEAEFNTQPDYVKNNPAVMTAFRKAQGTKAAPNPSVKQVRDDAKELIDAIAEIKNRMKKLKLQQTKQLKMLLT